MARDLRGDYPFTTGDIPSGAMTSYRLTFVNELWMLEAIMSALTLMVDVDNWNDVGPTTPDDAAILAIEMVEAFNPMIVTIGVILPFGGDVLPDGALWCDGASYLRDDYLPLFYVIGTTFGAVDGTHFNVPDMRRNVPIGAAPSGAAPNYTIGDQVGEADHTLIVSEMPSHSHADIGHAHADIPALPNITTIGPGAPQPTAIPGVGTTGAGFANLANTGGGNPHNNVQPSLAVNYIICTV